MAGDWKSGRRPTIKMPVQADNYEPPVKPKDLDDHGKWLWVNVIQRLIDRRVVESTDQAAIEQMCRMFSLWREADKLAAKDPIDKEIRCAVTAYQTSYQKIAWQFGVNMQMREKIKPSEQKAKGIQPRKRA